MTSELAGVTPVVLTLNEEANLPRILESLRSFDRVVVVDSGSTDRTAEIARSHPNVAWFEHPFEGHVSQWRWALLETEIGTPFVLALDADMAATPELLEEVGLVAAGAGADGGLIPFEYRIRGIPLAGSIYPAQLRLLRLARARVEDAGHTQEFAVHGRAVRFTSYLVHDDRKPLESFVKAQLRYSALELPRLGSGPGRGRLRTRLRRSFPGTPFLVWAVAWLRAGGPFRGAAARRYALERLLYEALLRWRVEDQLLTQGRSEGKERR